MYPRQTYQQCDRRLQVVEELECQRRSRLATSQQWIMMQKSGSQSNIGSSVNKRYKVRLISQGFSSPTNQDIIVENIAQCASICANKNHHLSLESCLFAVSYFHHSLINARFHMCMLVLDPVTLQQRYCEFSSVFLQVLMTIFMNKILVVCQI